MSEEDYWTRKEKYQQLVEDSAVSWHSLYTEEKAKREAIETKYNLLVQKIRKQGKDKVDDGDKFLRNYAKDWKVL